MQGIVTLRGSQYRRAHDWYSNESAGEIDASARPGRGRDQATRRVVKPRRPGPPRSQPPPIPHARPAANDDGATHFYQGRAPARLRPAASRRPAPPRPAAPRGKRARPAPAQRSNEAPAHTSSPAYLQPGLELPVFMLFSQRVKLVPASACLTDLSRSAAFIACAVLPTPGRQVVIRVAHEGGAGIAVGHVQKVMKGSGFAIRLQASTAEFRDFADAVRAYVCGEAPATPPLAEPVSVQVL